MKKRIIHVAQSAGGVYRYLESFLTYSNKDKYEIILVLSEDYIKYKEKLQQVSDYIEIIKMNREISIKDDLKASLSLRKIIKNYKPHLIYAHSSKAGAITRMTCLTNRIPVVYNPHGWAFNMKTSAKKKALYKVIERILAFRTQKIINISNYELSAALSSKIAPKEKMKLIYNGIETNIANIPVEDESTSLKILKSISEERIIIGAVGRISYQKSPLDFVEVAKKVSQQLPNSFFVWVGDGEERLQMEKLIKEYNLVEQFIITGWIENPTDYIKLFDISLLLSNWEGFGLVLIEYMLYRKPIIATRVDAIPELVEHGINGFTTDVHDTNKVTEYIMTYVHNHNLVEEYVEKSFIKVTQQFNIERVVSEHEMLFEEILGGK